MNDVNEHKDTAGTRDGERKWWLDDPSNVNKIVYGLYGLCALLAVADFVYHRHSILSFEAWPGFYAWYGFLGCVGLVLGAKEMRKLVKRDEDYYD